MSRTEQYISDYLALEMKTLEHFDRQAAAQVLEAMLRAYQTDGTIYVCGNGGSASTASHMANDFNKGISEYTDRKFRFYALTDNVATMLAIANDISYDEIFRFQLRGRLRPEDLVIGISGSGNSANVVNALAYAKEQGIPCLNLFHHIQQSGIDVSTDFKDHEHTNTAGAVKITRYLAEHLLSSYITK